MFDKLLKNFSFLIYISFLIICFNSSFAQEQDELNATLPAIPTAEEYRQIQQSLHYLTSDDISRREDKRLKEIDDGNRLKAARYLVLFLRYSEVKEAFLEALLVELNHNPPNTSLLIALTATSPFLSSQDAFILKKIRDRLNQLKEGSIPKNVESFLRDFINRSISRVPEDMEYLHSVRGGQYTLLTTQLYSLFSDSDSDVVKQHIRNFRKGSVQFLSDHLFLKEHYDNQVYQAEASQVMNTLYRTARFSISIRSWARSLIDTLAQTTRIPIIIGSKDINETVMRTTTQSISNTLDSAERKVYFVKTTPRQINRINKDPKSDFSKAKSLKDYLDALLDIEERLQIRIVLFIDGFHRLNDLQIGVLRSYLQRRETIKIVAATTREGYQAMSKEGFNFQEIRANRISRQRLRNGIVNSVLPRLQRYRFSFSMSEEAIDSFTDYIYRYYNYNDESLIRVARKVINDLLTQRSQRIAEGLDIRAYLNPVEITDDEVHEFIQNLRGQQEALNPCPASLTSHSESR